MPGRGRGSSASRPASPPPLVPLTLLRGPEELLARRVEEQLVAAAREVDPGVEVRRLEGTDLPAEHVSDLLAPDLFGTSRLLRVRQVGALPDEAVALLVAHAQEAGGGRPEPGGVWVVARDAGAQTDRSASARLAAAATVHDCSVKPWEALDALVAEARAQGVDADRAALADLAAAVGGDLLAQATALAQLRADLGAADPPVRGRLEPEHVARYHAGRAEAGGFDVATAAVSGPAPQALEALRWALASGTAELLVVGALASTLRDLARVAHLHRRPVGEVSSRLSLPPRKVETLRSQLRHWDPDRLSAAITAVARADVDVKGGGADREYAVERAVLAVLAARGA